MIQQRRDLGLFGLVIPGEFGGLSSVGYARVVQGISGLEPSLALTVGAHSSIGMKGLLMFGTREQKQKYLPRLATGELIAAFALTEPGSGSDALPSKTRAEKSADGEHWILNGQKLWPPSWSSGPSADSPTAHTRARWASGPRRRTSTYLDSVKVPVENCA